MRGFFFFFFFFLYTLVRKSQMAHHSCYDWWLNFASRDGALTPAVTVTSAIEGLRSVPLLETFIKMNQSLLQRV